MSFGDLISDALRLEAKRFTRRACITTFGLLADPEGQCDALGIEDPDAWPTFLKFLAIYWAAFIVALGVQVVFKHYRRLHYFLSRLVDCGRTASDSMENARTKFRELSFPRTKAVDGHTHGHEAAMRSSCSTFAENFAATIGRPAFFVSASRSDQRKGRAGSRSYFWSKDLKARPADFDPAPGSLLVMIDVDFHVDINSYLALGHPVLLYTVIPETACKARSGDEYGFTFDTDGKIVYDVSGGSSYCHGLWDYCRDTAYIPSWCGSPSFFERIESIVRCSCTFFNIEVRKVADNRALVFFSPTVRVDGYGPIAAATAYLQATPIEALNPIVECDGKKMIKLTVRSGTASYVSIGRPGRYHSVKISQALDSQLESLAIVTMNKIQAATVRQAALSVKEEISTNDATMLTEYYRLFVEAQGAKVDVIPIHNYTARDLERPFSDDDPKMLVSFMAPIVDGAFAAYMNKVNEERMVEGRVRQTKHMDLNQMSNFTRVAAREFNEFVLGNYAGTLVPCDVDELYERQNRPAQVRILNEGALGHETDAGLLRAFTKREPARSVSDPRNISTTNPYHKFVWSRYIISLSELMKKACRWYVVGRTPLEISQRVAHIAMTARSHAQLGDFSRMDKNVVQAANVLYLELLLAAYHADYHDEIRERWEATRNNRGICSLGTTYDQEESRASGDAATSNGNTYITGQIMYLARRMMGDQPADAWNWLQESAGACGDDSISADLGDEEFVRASRCWGQVAKSQSVAIGEIGVEFLSRQFASDVFQGNPNNICDIARVLTKFHVTRHLGAFTESEKCYAKAYSLMITDRETPLVGAIADFLVRLYRVTHEGRKVLDLSEFDRRELSWWAGFPAESGFANEPHPDFWTILQSLPINPDAFYHWRASVFARWEQLRGGGNVAMKEVIEQFPHLGILGPLATKAPAFPAAIDGLDYEPAPEEPSGAASSSSSSAPKEDPKAPKERSKTPAPKTKGSKKSPGKKSTRRERRQGRSADMSGS